MATRVSPPGDSVDTAVSPGLAGFYCRVPDCCTAVPDCCRADPDCCRAAPDCFRSGGAPLMRLPTSLGPPCTPRRRDWHGGFGPPHRASWGRPRSWSARSCRLSGEACATRTACAQSLPTQIHQETRLWDVASRTVCDPCLPGALTCFVACPLCAGVARRLLRSSNAPGMA